MVRVGGGFMNFVEWLQKFGKREGIVLNGGKFFYIIF